MRKAIAYYEQHLAIARELGDRGGEATSSWNLGNELGKQGNIIRAIPLMQVAVNFERELGHPNADTHAAIVEDLRKRLNDTDSNGGEAA